MISVIAGALFEDTEDHFNVYFESIGGIRAKYHVARKPIKITGLFVDAGVFDKGRMNSRKSYPYAVVGEPDKALAVAIDNKTVNTNYTANREVQLQGVMHVDTNISRDAVTHVCYL